MKRWTLAAILASSVMVACSRSGPPPRPPPSPSPDLDGREAAPTSKPTLAEAVDTMFREATEGERFAGTVLVAERGRIVLEKAYGLADPETARPNRPDTIFRIGSMTKQFTAAAILALEEEGRLEVDAAASKYLPTYPRERLVAGGVEVTIRHLLTHTAGIPPYEKTKQFADTAWKRPIAPDEIIAAVSSEPLEFTPGSSFRYSNTGYNLLGRVIENVTGERYETYLRRRFFEPLGMHDTGVALPASKQDRAGIGIARVLGHDIAFTKSSRFHDPDLTLTFAAGSVYSTVEDLHRWDRALAADTALSETSKAKLFAPARDHYAFGWVIRSIGGAPAHWHNGALSLGYCSAMLRVPRSGTFVVYLSNLDRSLVADDLDSRIATLVRTEMPPRPLRRRPRGDGRRPGSRGP